MLAPWTLALLGACGSSSNGSHTTSATVSQSTGPHTIPSSPPASTRRSGATGATGSAGRQGQSSGSPSATVKFQTTPKYGSPRPSAPVRSGLVQVAYRYITIMPDTLRVKVGATIRWTNYDSATANVTSEGGPQKFASRDFGKGGTFEVTVTRPGVIHYECTLYPATMNGTIEVVS